jgi:hypothetical protein
MNEGVLQMSFRLYLTTKKFHDYSVEYDSNKRRKEKSVHVARRHPRQSWQLLSTTLHDY